VASFDFFRQTGHQFTPKTSNGALKALAAHILPAEAYVYVATSTRPLDEEPYDIDQIERILGRENLDIDTNLLLMKILERLLRRPEQEVALFAAESINLIEGRYAKRIEDIKEGLDESADPGSVRELAGLYSELSRLYPPHSSLRGFYLHEAYRWLKSLRDSGQFGAEESLRLIRVLIDLGLYDQAASEIANHPIAAGEDREILLLEAEVEFQRHHYSRIGELCRRLDEHSESLNARERSMVECWLGVDDS